MSLPRPVDIEQAFREAIEKLGAQSADSAHIGGVALAVYGIERYTKDLDLATTAAATAAVAPRVAGLDPRPLRIGGLSFLATSSAS